MDFFRYFSIKNKMIQTQVWIGTSQMKVLKEFRNENNFSINSILTIGPIHIARILLIRKYLLFQVIVQQIAMMMN